MMRWYNIYSLNDNAIQTFQEPDMIQDYRDIILFIMGWGSTKLTESLLL